MTIDNVCAVVGSWALTFCLQILTKSLADTPLLDGCFANIY